jgi:acetyl esterase/lipase
MTTSAIERKIRARLPIIRMMQVYMPLRLMHWLVKKGVATLQLPADITRRSVNAGGVACDWLLPEGASSDRVLLYFHGGGFVIPQTPNHLLLGAYLH